TCGPAGEGDTPGGRVTPPLRTHPPEEHVGDPRHQLPSASRPFDLPPGVNRLGFKGKYDVDWDVYLISNRPQQALIGNWAVTPWGGHITDKEERQHILRVRGTGPFTTVILPWRRGEKPKGLSVRYEGNAVVVSTAASTARIEPTGYTYTAGGRSVSRKFQE